MANALFYLLAFLALTAAVNVVARRSAVVSALYLVAVFGCLSGIFLLMGFPVIAGIQILVYAGAIMVLFLFVIMLLDIRHEKGRPRGVRWIAPWCIGALMAGIGIPALWAVSGTPSGGGETVEALGRKLLGDFVLPFEVTGLLILVAIVGVMVLASRLNRQEHEGTDPGAQPAPASGGKREGGIRLTSPGPEPEKVEGEEVSA